MSILAPIVRPLSLTPRWAKNELWRKARAVPSIDLRFADSKSLVDAYTGQSLVTFTRASSGTFVGSNGLVQTAATDVPRFDHNPTTGESLGLLVEEARTNLLLRSEAIATGPWFNSNVTSTNNTSDVLDPVGGSTATKVVATGSNSAFGQPLTLTAAIHAGSIWLRSATGNISAQLIVYLGGAPFTNIGTTNVTITTTWQRFSVITSAATAASYNIQLNNIGAGTVYAWGAQLEAGAFATSYIPTTSATVTRAADVASITGTNFSSWYNQTEGTFYTENRIGGFQTNFYPNVFNANDSTNNNVINAYRLDYAIRYIYGVIAGGVVQTGFSQSPLIAAGAVAKMATAVATNNGILVVNGTEQGADSSLTMPTNINRLQILGGGDMTIRRICYWPTRLANSTLQTITQ